VVYIVPEELLSSGTIHPMAQDHFTEDKDPQLHLCEKIKTCYLRFDRDLKSASSLLFGSQFSAVLVPKPGTI